VSAVNMNFFLDSLDVLWFCPLKTADWQSKARFNKFLKTRERPNYQEKNMNNPGYASTMFK
jgi:hypothetical protein